MANNPLSLGPRFNILLQEAVGQGIDRAALVQALQNLPPDQFAALRSSQATGFAALNQAMGGQLDPAKTSTTLGGERKPSSAWKGLTDPRTLAFLAAPLAVAAAPAVAGAVGAAGAAGSAASGAGALSALGQIGNIARTAAPIIGGVANAIGGAQSGGQADKYAEAAGEAGLRETADRERIRAALLQRMVGSPGGARPDLSATFAGSQNPFGSVAPRMPSAPIPGALAPSGGGVPPGRDLGTVNVQPGTAAPMTPEERRRKGLMQSLVLGGR
jgi:hypothetical protein